MKVETVKNISYNTKVYDTHTGNKYQKQVNPNYAPATQLPNYESVSSKFPLNIASFSGNFVKRTTDEINREYLDQIEAAEQELEILKGAKNSDALKTAIEENEFYDDFQRNRSTYYNTAQKRANSKESIWRENNDWWYKLWHGSELADIRSNEMDYYYDKYNRAEDIEPRYEGNKNLINAEKENAENKAKRIKELEELIDKLKKLIDYGGLRKTIDDALMGQGGLNDRIAGYSSVKNKIRKFIESISVSKNNEDAYVSPCVLLYGDTGTGKTTFLHAIEHMASDDVEIIRFDNNDSVSFKKRFQDACRDAQNRYKDTQKRTILLMDDAEKYFCMPLAEAETFYKDELDASDMEKLETINKSGSNIDVKDFKAILDVLSQIPDDDFDGDSYKSAMSIFITTNHPNLIDRQLIKRPEKMDAYHVGPAQGKDLNAVVEFYFKDKVKIIKDLKRFKDRPDMEAAIDSLANLDIDAKNSIKNHFRADKAEMLDIDPSEVDFSAITEDIQPSIEEGAYSNVMIKRISFNAFERYLQNPEDPYQVYFYDELQNTARDIEPQRYKRYLETANFVNLYKQSTQIKNIQDKQEFVKLLDKRNKKLISASDSANLQNFLKQMKFRLNELKDKQKIGTITESECIELENLKEQDALNENPQMVKDYLKANKTKG